MTTPAIALAVDEQKDMTHHQEKLHAGEIKAKVVKGSENLAQVLLREPPRPASKRMLQFYCMIFLTFLCSTMNGYDGSLMSALLVMKPFLNEFGANYVGIKAGIITAVRVLL